MKKKQNRRSRPKKTKRPENYFEIQQLLEASQSWIKGNPDGTLQHFADFLDEVMRQAESFDEQDVIEEIEDEMDSELYDYLKLWDAAQTCGEPHTIGYRMANIDDDQTTVEELIEELGPDTRITDLKRAVKAA